MILAATGHRPNKLGKYGYSKETFDKLVAVATKAIIEEKPTQIISGMALGWDQAVAQSSIDLKIPFIAAVPFNGQESIWPQESQTYYRKLLSSANEKVVVSPLPYKQSLNQMQKRNEWMVDHCNKVLALWNKSVSGGTWNCIEYANNKQKPIRNVWNDYIKLNTNYK